MILLRSFLGLLVVSCECMQHLTDCALVLATSSDRCLLTVHHFTTPPHAGIRYSNHYLPRGRVFCYCLHDPFLVFAASFLLPRMAPASSTYYLFFLLLCTVDYTQLAD